MDTWRMFAVAMIALMAAAAAMGFGLALLILEATP